jgi:hypothetical protein
MPSLPTRFSNLSSVASGPIGCLPREARHKADAGPRLDDDPDSQTLPPEKRPRVVFWEPQLWLPDGNNIRFEIVRDNRAIVICVNAVWFPQKLTIRSTIAMVQHILQELFQQGAGPRVDHGDYTRQVFS